MDAAQSLHPTDQTLSSYGLGKLDDRSAEAVNEHLIICTDCRKRVAEMSADSFLQRVRDAQKSSAGATSGQPQAAGTLTDEGANTFASSSGDSIPPVLATHPDYEFKRELGRGGMGVVYLAHNRLMGRDEVLKVMGQHLMDDPGVLERFLREIRSVARLRHPNIVTAHHATRFGPSVLFAMEYVEGLDLCKLVKTQGPMPVADACLFIRQAALGLQHAHEEGLVHRDIKPHNLMLSRKGDKATVKILDFGLAKAAREEKADGGLTAQGQALGTPDYIAPEQIVDAPTADIRADIYSLGGTLYYLLTGRPPFQEKSLYDLYQAHISREADPLNLVRPDVPAELAALVAKMMAKDPSQRFQTPGEVAQALTPFIENANVAVNGPEADISRAGPVSVGQPAWMWPAVAAGVLAIGLFAAWLGGLLVKVKTPDGVIVLEKVPKDSEILVDGKKITVTWPGSGKPLEIRAVPGRHTVEVKKDGFKTFGETVTFKQDDAEEVTVRLEALEVNRPGKAEATTPSESASRTPAPLQPQEITNTVGMKLVRIPAGEFLMGSPESDKDAGEDENPQHRVRIMRPFYLGATEVTQGQFRAVAGQSPSSFKGSDDLPVEQVSWDDAVSFCKKLTELEKGQLGGASYRLPTEAEWEYACRAGSTTRYSFDDAPASLGEFAWYSRNSGSKIHPVGQKRANAFNLYDMHGNVWEWCQDGYQTDYYKGSPSTDPPGASGAANRVIRGGSWGNFPQGSRSAYRSRSSPGSRFNYLGFRVARVQAGL